MKLATLAWTHGSRPAAILPDGRAVDLLELERSYFFQKDIPSEGRASWFLREHDGKRSFLAVENMQQAMEHIGEVLSWYASALANGVEKLDLSKAATEFFQTHPHQFLAPTAPRSFRDFYAFEAHVKNARKRRGLDMLPQWYEFPVFYYSNTGTLIGHEATLCAPRDCNELDYELELGVIIGKAGKDIPPEKAWEHIAGFTIINDFSARDIQRKEMAIGLGPAKGKDFATGVGPYLVTLDEFKDRIDAEGRVDLEMCARVNGKELSRGNAKTMHFTWPQIISRASADAELFPGDLIGSGTVGTGCILELGPENTGGWLKPGDVVELEIERLGVLRNRVVERNR